MDKYDKSIGIKISRRELYTIMGQGIANCISNDNSSFIAKIPFEFLQKIGFPFNNYEIICEIINIDNNIYISPMKEEYNPISLLEK